MKLASALALALRPTFLALALAMNPSSRPWLCSPQPWLWLWPCHRRPWPCSASLPDLGLVPCGLINITVKSVNIWRDVVSSFYSRCRSTSTVFSCQVLSVCLQVLSYRSVLMHIYYLSLWLFLCVRVFVCVSVSESLFLLQHCKRALYLCAVLFL